MDASEKDEKNENLDADLLGKEIEDSKRHTWSGFMSKNHKNDDHAKWEGIVGALW